MPITRPEISLSEDEQKRLVKILQEHAVQGAEYKGNWDVLHDQYWRYYLAKADDIGSDWPWPGASKYFAPMIQASVDMLGSLFYDAMFSQPPAMVGTDDMDKADAEKLNQFYFKYVWNKQISLGLVGNDWNFNTLIDGTAVMKTRWSQDRFIYRWDDVQIKPKYSTLKTSAFGVPINEKIPTGTTTNIIEVAETTQTNRPIVEMVNLERLFIAPGTTCGTETCGSLQWPNCKWFYEVQYWDKYRMRESFYAGGFENIPEPDSDDFNQLFADYDMTYRERSQHQSEQMPETNGRGCEVQVHYMRLALPGTIRTLDGKTETQSFMRGVEEETIVWYVPGLNKIIRIMPLCRYKPDNLRPYIENRYTRNPPYWYGQGVPSKMEQTQKLYNSATRQMIDYGTLQNLPWAFYEPATMGLLPDIRSLQPGALVPVNNAKGITIPRFQGNPQFWQMIENISQQWSERLTNVTDFTQGRSPSVPNAPRTAKGQGMMLQQSNIAFSHRVALMATPYYEMFRQVHMLYRRFAPPEIEYSYFNEDAGVLSKAKISRNAFQADVDFSFDLNPDKMMKRQDAQLLLSTIQNSMFLAQDPEAGRMAMRDMFSAFDRLDLFEQIWPQEKLQVMQQAQQMGAQPPGSGQEPGQMQELPQEPEEPAAPGADIPKEDIGDLAVNL